MTKAEIEKRSEMINGISNPKTEYMGECMKSLFRGNRKLEKIQDKESAEYQNQLKEIDLLRSNLHNSLI